MDFSTQADLNSFKNPVNSKPIIFTPPSQALPPLHCAPPLSLMRWLMTENTQVHWKIPALLWNREYGAQAGGSTVSWTHRTSLESPEPWNSGALNLSQSQSKAAQLSWGWGQQSSPWAVWGEEKCVGWQTERTAPLNNGKGKIPFFGLLRIRVIPLGMASNNIQCDLLWNQAQQVKCSSSKEIPWFIPFIFTALLMSHLLQCPLCPHPDNSTSIPSFLTETGTMCSLP